jgi:endonuclease G
MMVATPPSGTSRTGYDPDFLAVRIEPPPAPEPTKDSPLLPYTHFTVCLNTHRRLAWWVAWNIDGHRLHPGEGALSRDGIDFAADDRVPNKYQALDDVYYKNRFDRGHIARRADLLWGDLAEAKAANLDSFYFPNITPQLDIFNQSRRAGELDPRTPVRRLSRGGCSRTPCSPSMVWTSGGSACWAAQSSATTMRSTLGC